MRRIMKTHYSNSEYVIIEERGKFGVATKNGNFFLPITYDSIFCANGTSEGTGFILSMDGKFGYAEFCEQKIDDSVNFYGASDHATVCLPCIYDLIEPKSNGLAILSSCKPDGGYLWYDYKSHTLYRQMRWMGSFGNFDALLDFSRSPCIPELKRAGSDEWVRMPRSESADPIAEIFLGKCDVGCILCSNEIPSGYEYFFLLLYDKGWTVTRSYKSIPELYSELPPLINGIYSGENAATKAYTLLCKYKKRKVN